MAYEKFHSTKGSSNSKSRWEKRAIVKKGAKKARRQEDKRMSKIPQ